MAWNGKAAASESISTLLATHERSAWSGLQVAVPVWLLLAGGIALGWPGLLAGDARLIAVIAYAVALPLSHALLQTAPSKVLVHGLPVLDMDADDHGEAVEDTPPLAPAAASETERQRRCRGTDPQMRTPLRAAVGSSAPCNCWTPVRMRAPRRRPRTVIAVPCRCWRRCCRTCACCAG